MPKITDNFPPTLQNRISAFYPISFNESLIPTMIFKVSTLPVSIPINFAVAIVNQDITKSYAMNIQIKDGEGMLIASGKTSDPHPAGNHTTPVPTNPQLVSGVMIVSAPSVVIRKPSDVYTADLTLMVPGSGVEQATTVFTVTYDA